MPKGVTVEIATTDKTLCHDRNYLANSVPALVDLIPKLFITGKR